MVGPSGRPATDASCTVKLPATSFPKDQIKVLLLENINQTAIDIFRAEGFQLVSVLPPHCKHMLLGHHNSGKSGKGYQPPECLLGYKSC